MISSFNIRTIAAVTTVVLAAMLLVLMVQPAEATFPGDNGKIAFESDQDGNHEIYVMNADGSGQNRLTNDAAWDTDPAFSPDGSKIAFSSDRGGEYAIYVMNADGTGTQLIADTVGIVDKGPAWSPDGEKIAFAGGGIKVVSADGNGSPTQLTTAYDTDPDWSPDGSKIAFTSNRPPSGGSYQYDIFVMNADGSAQTRLTNDAAVDHKASWSPDGSEIAFSSKRIHPADNSTDSEIWAMNSDGSTQSPVTNNNYDDFRPSWSPDGQEMAFERCCINGNRHEIYVRELSSGAETELTNNAAFDNVVDWQTADFTPPTVETWKPTGNKVKPTAKPFVTFSEAMDEASVEASANGKPTTFVLKKGAKMVPASVTYVETATGAYKATLKPNKKLKAGAKYTATVTTGAKDEAGNAAVVKSWRFTVKR